jgi:hypothetical protein
MPARLAKRLGAARHERFVGRRREIEIFESVLKAAQPPFQVLYLFGPGGIGKTSLLREFQARAELANVAVFFLDGRNLEATPDSFRRALSATLNLAPEENPLDVLSNLHARHVLLLDTYETWSALDTWLRDEFLPQLSENALVVIAGREPLSPAWQSDPGWQMLTRTLALRNLSPDEGREFLTRREIPPAQHAAVLDFTHGFPLALSLVADVFDQRRDLQFQPENAPDVIRILLQRFAQKVPGPAHRAALEACAMVRVLTEALLAAMLKLPDPTTALAPNADTGAASARELFEWLRGLSFMDASRGGIFLHDLARETLIADVRWRNPDWYRELHSRARKFYTTRLPHAPLAEQQRILFDFVFLHRDNPVMRQMFDWHPEGVITPDALRAQDVPVLLALIERYEGAESRAWAEKWLARQPEKTTVYRDENGAVIGLFVMVEMQNASAAELDADPATRRAWNFLQSTAPLRAGEVGTLYRFWMARDSYQGVSAVQTQIFLTTVRYQLLTPGLAYHFFPCADADFWAPVLMYGDLTRLPQVDFQVDGKTYGVFGHDWRVRPPLAWLDLLAQREVASNVEAVEPPPASPLIVLSEDEFASAVQDALRDFARPHRLRTNPLLSARMVLERAGETASADERMHALQTMLRDAIETPQVSPREAKLYRAVEYTYLKPSMTQEQAAEQLDLQFSTYRRHLKAGLLRVTDALWQKEIGASAR